MSISTTRKNMVSDLLAVFENHIQTPEQQRTSLVAEVHLRGDLDEVYKEIIDQVEAKFGHEHGLETRSDRVATMYLIGKHYRFCTVEIRHKEKLHEDRAYLTHYISGNTYLIVEN